MVYSDMTALLKTGSVRIGASYRINGNWSVGGYTQTHIEKQKKETEGDIHKMEFSESTLPEATSDKERRYAGIHACFWPGETYKGAFISAGAKIKDDDKTDCTLGMGICMKILGAVYATASIEIDIIESHRRQTFTGNGTGISICIIF